MYLVSSFDPRLSGLQMGDGHWAALGCDSRCQSLTIADVSCTVHPGQRNPYGGMYFVLLHGAV
jgi:hypothetical protein